jgi:hypothetical protein
MEITGQIKEVFATQTISEKFKKREFVLTTDGSTPYPNHLLIQVTNAKCDLLNSYSSGDEVTVSINLRGREYQNPTKGTQYFNSIEAWAIKGVSQFTKPAPNVQAENHAFVNNSNKNDNDDLPF